MISLTITSVPAFTKDLFVGDIFDRFQLSEAVFHTDFVFTLEAPSPSSASMKEETTEEPAGDWGSVRRIAFEIVRGKKLPKSFRIALAASEDMIAEVAEAEKGFFTENPELIDSLILNIYYKDQIIRLTTSTSLKLFSPEQPALDKVWDQYVAAFLEMNEIDFRDDL